MPSGDLPLGGPLQHPQEALLPQPPGPEHLREHPQGYPARSRVINHTPCPRSGGKAPGLVPSMGSIGDCYDNSMIESFWSRMQVELLDRQRGTTRIELANAMFDYIEIWHNRQRRHSSLGMVAPIQ